MLDWAGWLENDHRVVRERFENAQIYSEIAVTMVIGQGRGTN